MSNKLTTIVSLFIALEAYASTTNIINIAEISACGTGTIDGWSISGIDSYADKTSIRLNNNEEYLVSPDFGAKIQAIILDVKSSSKSGRRLAFIPRINGTFDMLSARYCDYSSSKDTYERQILTDLPDCTSFKIAFNAIEGGVTGWGISYLAIVTDDIPSFKSPGSISVNRIKSTRATLNWENSSLAVSNLITVLKISKLPCSFAERVDYDFELCSNSGNSDSQDKSTDLNGKYPDLTSEKVYYPANSSGIIRISTKDTNGRLTHCGFQSYDHMALQICVKRYAGDNNCSQIFAYYLDGGEKPHAIGTIPITDEFTVGTIDLSDVPGGLPISIGNLDGYKSNRRFILQNMTFLKGFVPESITTNLAFSTVATGATSVDLLGLDKKTEYLATIIAFDAEGRSTAPSEPVSFTTQEATQSMLLKFR